MFNTVEAFRLNATEKDYEELRNFYYQSKNKNEDFKNSEYYGFSSSSALTLIKEHYEPDQEHEEENHELIITKDTLPVGNFKQASLSLKESTLEKYQQFCAEYECYSKQAILTMIIEKGLEYYCKF